MTVFHHYEGQEFSGAAGEIALIEQLRQGFESLTREPVSHPDDLMLRPNVTVSCGTASYRFSRDGLHRICRELCPGLASLVQDLSGVKRDPRRPEQEYDTESASRIFNAVLARRYERLESKLLIRDIQAKVIDGIHGRTHHWMPNSQAYESVAAVAAQYGLRFAWARLCGRQLLAHLCHPTEADFGFHRGIQFFNTDGCDAAARVSGYYYNPKLRLGFATDRQRIVHVGAKAALALDAAAKTAAQGPMLAISLRLSSLREQVVEKHISGTGYPAGIKSLQVAGLSLKRAQRIWDHSRMRRYGDLRDLEVSDIKSQTPLTALDVWAALARCSRRFSIETQEKYDRMVYRLFAGTAPIHLGG